ncbi:XkdX family protein [Planococcaceae bacterium Storch 2/2-2]|nr:XkdX family protein [Planococcaceae bacterium Storch 2/2-2]
MAFWRLAYNEKWITEDKLRMVVKTDQSPYGELTPEEFELITGQKF